VDPRDVEARLKRSAKRGPSFVLTGARQTGKTSTFRHLFPDYAFVSLDSHRSGSRPEKEPERFLAASSRRPVISIEGASSRHLAFFRATSKGGSGCPPHAQRTVPAYRIAEVLPNEETSPNAT